MSSESGSKDGIMEAMSNEGPHIRDYGQKSEILWNESATRVKHNIYKTTEKTHIKSHLWKKKKKQFYNTYTIVSPKWTNVLNISRTTSKFKGQESRWGEEGWGNGAPS